MRPVEWMSRPWHRAWLWFLSLSLLCGCAKSAEQPAPRPDGPSPEYARILDAPSPPYTFTLGGLTADEVQKLGLVPGVQEVKAQAGRVRVVWQPYTWAPKRWWTKGADGIYDFLVIKGKLGKTEWTHGGRSNGCPETVIFSQYRNENFSFAFNDLSTRHNELMKLHCYCSPLPGQVEHEMLRFIAGTKVEIEKCGSGYVIVSRAGRGRMVAWQVSEQAFAIIYDSYDKEMVAAYVDRLGSCIPKDYKVSVDKWVENEIRWRIIQMDNHNAWGTQLGHVGRSGTVLFGPYVWMFFPETLKLHGQIRLEDATVQERWEWLDWVRHWLWANRANLKYDDATRGYVLKGKDLYDPKNPPELPEELRGPPKPQPDQAAKDSKGTAEPATPK